MCRCVIVVIYVCLNNCPPPLTSAEKKIITIIAIEIELALHNTNHCNNFNY